MARDKGSFLGGKLHYGDKPTNVDMSYFRDKEATQWRNRRPICPYGCGQEGQLVEIVVTPGKGAIGYYKDSEQLVFTAPMKMMPKPSSKKIVIGPDGEPQLTEGDE